MNFHPRQDLALDRTCPSQQSSDVFNGKSKKDNRAKRGFSFHQLSVNSEKVKSNSGSINYQLEETHLIMITTIKDVTKS